MGTDITAFIETAIQGRTGLFWSAYAQLWIPRDRELFTALGAYGSDEALRAAKGLPSDSGFEVADSYHLWVVDPQDELEWRGQAFVPRERADAWVQQNKTAYAGPARDRIADPDHFSPSWLTHSEVLAAVRYADIDLRPRPDFTLALSLMLELEAIKPLGVRLVFWFSA